MARIIRGLSIIAAPVRVINATKIYFREFVNYIYSSGAGVLKLVAGTLVEIGSAGARCTIEEDLDFTVVGKFIGIKHGTNARGGTATLVGGTVTVSTTEVTASSNIWVGHITFGGTTGHLSTPTASIVAGTSFVILSSSALDTSTVKWMIIEPT